jgi:hypothetical protein
MSDPALLDAPQAVSEPPQALALSNGRTGPGKRLSLRAKSLILQLHESGKSHTEIAQVIGCSIPTITYTLDELCDNRILARRQLEAAAPKLVKTITQSKDAATALRALGKLDVVRDESEKSGTNIAIVIGQPGHALSPPTITVQALSPVDNSVRGETKRIPE